MSITTQSHNASLVIDIELVDHPETVKMDLICQKNALNGHKRSPLCILKTDFFNFNIFICSMVVFGCSFEPYLISIFEASWYCQKFTRFNLKMHSRIKMSLYYISVHKSLLYIYRLLWLFIYTRTNLNLFLFIWKWRANLLKVDL